MPLDQAAAKKLIDHRHCEWKEHHGMWRWLLDSLEGGEQYREATYGTDYRGELIRNLIRHKREYPDPRENVGSTAVYLAGTATGLAGSTIGSGGGKQGQYANSDDYELRRARTPVPAWVSEVVETYTSKIFAAEVTREAPEGAEYDGLRAWWSDVDGQGTSIDDWMEHTVGPLVLAFGMIDLAFDHPAPSGGQAIATDKEAITAGVKGCIASHVLPENVVDWKRDDRGAYQECLVQEFPDGDMQERRFRHWTADGWALYDCDGKLLDDGTHAFRRVPIERIFDRKSLRGCHVGKSRMETAADLQHEFYNRDSELILSDTIQAHPLLQGPDDYCESDSTIPLGPGYLLPKKKNTSGGSVTYEGFEAVNFPKEAATSLRENKRDLRDELDRVYRLTKPAGAVGTGRGTVGQSGVSKEIDHDSLHGVLSQVAKAFARVESRAAMMALAVLFDGKPPMDAKDRIKISYPTIFNLAASGELTEVTTDLQGILAAAGDAPETETMLCCEIVRKALPGRDDETYERLDLEIERAISAKAARAEQAAEMTPPAAPGQPAKPGPANPGGTDPEADSDAEPGSTYLQGNE